MSSNGVTTTTTTADQLRLELNLKNLRRHDAQIDKIIASTPYVTVYYNTGQDWVKTGIEGPMFLFSRTVQPQFGFFVLNRQGLEYVQEFLTPTSDVKVEGQFILYEPHEEADRATGIWIAEEKDRVELCRKMQQIRALAVKQAATAVKARAPALASTPPQQASLPLKQSIPLEMLFGSPPPQSTPAPIASASTSVPALDMLFASSSAPLSSPPGQMAPSLPSQPRAQAPVSPAPAPAPAPPPASSSTGLSLLDSIFATATAPVPVNKVVAASSPPQPNDARALLAMLGHPVAQLPPPLPAKTQPQAQLSVKAQIPAQVQAQSQAQTRRTSPPALVPTSTPAVTRRGAASPSPAPSTELTAPSSVAQIPAPAQIPASASSKPQAQKQERQTTTAATSMFAPPLLSHDIFDGLPLPGKSGRDRPGKTRPAAVVNGASDGAASGVTSRLMAGNSRAGVGTGADNIKSEQKQERGVSQQQQQQQHLPQSQAQERVIAGQPHSKPKLPSQAQPRVNGRDPSPSAASASAAAPAAASSAAAPDSRAASAASRNSRANLDRATPSASAPSSSAAATLKKSVVLDLVDALAVSQRVGIVDHAGTDSGAGQKVLDQDEFVRRVAELLADRAWQTRLYARYLDRVEVD